MYNVGGGGQIVEINEHSHVHKKIRMLCYQLELLSDMKLISDFTSFDEIKLLGKLGYITIDFKRNAVYSLGIKLTKIEWDIIKEILTYCQWLETGLNIAENRQNRVTK